VLVGKLRWVLHDFQEERLKNIRKKAQKLRQSKGTLRKAGSKAYIPFLLQQTFLEIEKICHLILFAFSIQHHDVDGCDGN